MRPQNGMCRILALALSACLIHPEIVLAQATETTGPSQDDLERQAAEIDRAQAQERAAQQQQGQANEATQAAQQQASVPGSSSETPPAGVPANSLKVQFVLPDPTSHWSLLGGGDKVLCTLPCTYWVPQSSSYKLRLDVARTSDQVFISLPDDLGFTPGTKLMAKPMLGADPSAKSAMMLAGFLVAGSIVLPALLLGVLLPTSGDSSSVGPIEAAFGGIAAAGLIVGIIGVALPDSHLDLQPVMAF